MPRNGLVRVAGAGGRGSVRIDGGCTALHLRLDHARRRSAVDRRDPPPGPLPPLAGPDVLRDRRPGGGGRHAAQRRGDRARSSHAILFTGPRGTGKTSLARILAKALNCTDLAAERRPLRPLPVLRRDPRGPGPRPGRDRRRVQPRHRRRPRAARAPRLRARRTCGARSTSSTRRTRSRRTPGTRSSSRSRSRPTSSTFMFASTHPQEFPPAILSRLQRFDVRRLTVPEITGKLERILAADGREADPEAVAVDRAPGRRRDARRGVDPGPAARLDRRAASRPTRSATSWASPTPSWSTAFVAALADGRRGGGHRAARPARGARPGPARVPGPGRRRAARAAARRAWRPAAPADPGARRRRPPPGLDRPDAARPRRPAPPAGARAARARASRRRRAAAQRRPPRAARPTRGPAPPPPAPDRRRRRRPRAAREPPHAGARTPRPDRRRPSRARSAAASGPRAEPPSPTADAAPAAPPDAGRGRARRAGDDLERLRHGWAQVVADDQQEQPRRSSR